MKKNLVKKVPIILAGNKLDLKNDINAAIYEEEHQFSNKNGFCAFYETSAKENININECFIKLIENIQ